MCGIGAILRTDGRPIPDSWLDAIDARIAYRGPDGLGRFRDRVEVSSPSGRRTLEVALIHRRLSIIDHAGGGQPMVSKRGRTEREGMIAVVANGCIYNHRELRRELESLGHRFVTDHSDTEVLLHGHREWGPQLQDHLEGMYAYALWDRGSATLTLGRDWFGEKPLYHRIDSDEGRMGLVVAASNAEAVGAVPGGEVVDDAGLGRFVARYLQLGRSWRGRTVTSSAVEVANVDPSGHERFSADEAGQRLDDDGFEHLIEQAVARRLEADVPLGCFLSGGVDSSLIAYFARKHKPDLRTFSVRMPDPRYDESKHAAAVARHLGTDHATLPVDPNPAEDLLMLVRTLGQPFGDSSILPTYWVSRAAREHVKVALSGDGGDELFLGYERYFAARLLDRHWRLLGRLPQFLLRRSHPRSRRHTLGRLGEMARNYAAAGVLATESIFTESQIEALLGRPRPEEEEQPCPPLAPGTDLDALGELRWADVTGYLPDDLLCKVDTASMTVALEVRCPMLDRDLARAALAAPIGQLIPRRRRKGLLRRIARRHLPAAAVDRRKMGFAVPIGQWFRADFGGLRALLLDHLNSAEPFGPIHLERPILRGLIEEHMAGTVDHGQRLFALLTLSIWARGS